VDQQQLLHHRLQLRLVQHQPLQRPEVQSDKDNQPVPTTPGSALQNVNFVGRDFKLPSLYKANLAFDHELPWYGMVASAELLVTKVKDGLYYQHLNLGKGRQVGADGRVNYYVPSADGRAWAPTMRVMVMPHRASTTST
jgi:hypothetical protein